MLGIDITRSPHPKALLLFSPLLSGGIFLIGAGYFRPELMEHFFAYKLESSLRLLVLLIVSYATGMMLSAAVALPFMFVTYLFSYFATAILITLARLRLKIPIQPSSRSVFRRTATVILGSAAAPPAPDATATALVERLLSFFTRASSNQAAGAHQTTIPDEAQLKLEALKLFAPDFEEQWNDIHKGLYQLQMREQSPSDAVIGIEPILSVAGTIMVWRWLSFPVPLPLYYAALLTFACIGLTLVVVGIAHGLNYMDGSSLSSFLFERLLDRGKGAKVGE